MKHAKCRMNPVAGVLLAVLLLWQAGLSGCDFSALALYTATYMDVFETVLTLRIASTSRTAADNAAAAVHARMLELHREFDIYHDWAGMNNLKTVNDHAGDGKPIPVSEDILNLLELGRVAFDFSGGQVNICMGSVLSLWHTARETETLPDAAALERAARHTAPHALQTATAAGTVLSIQITAFCSHSVSPVSDSCHNRSWFFPSFHTAGSKEYLQLPSSSCSVKFTVSAFFSPDVYVISYCMLQYIS